MGIESGRKATVTSDYQRDWPAYFDAVKDQPPRETCVRALDAFERDGGTGERAAVDLACGEGRDTREMLRRPGPPTWRVFALDATPRGVLWTRARVAPADRDRCEVVECDLEAVAARFASGVPLGPGGAAVAADFVNASFALPFCREEAFPALWAWVRNVLKPGGRFAGQFFGDRDEWAAVNPRRHHTRAATLALLDGLTLEHFDEVEKDGSDALGGTKRHHLFHVVARRL